MIWKNCRPGFHRKMICPAPVLLNLTNTRMQWWDDREHVRSMVVRVGHVALHSDLAGFRELGATEFHTARLGLLKHVARLPVQFVKASAPLQANGASTAGLTGPRLRSPLEPTGPLTAVR